MAKNMMNRISNPCFRFIVILGIAIMLLSAIHCARRIPSERLEEPDAVFEAECSTCHSLAKALNVTKDETAWEQTTILLNKKQAGEISKDKVVKLVNLHRTQHKKEQGSLFKDCSKCHEPVRTPIETNTAAERHKAIKYILAEKTGLARDEDLELLINYHRREQRSKLTGILKNVLPLSPEERPLVDVFIRECSTCHDLERVLSAQKDQAAWQQTITTMSQKQGSPVKQSEVEDLVRLHIKQQETEQKIFKQYCSKCHPTEQVFEKITTQDEWRRIIRHMAAKVPSSISEEEIDFLINFHKRNYKKIEQMFKLCCTECHDLKKALKVSEDRMTMEKTIVTMVEKTSGKISYKDALKFVEFHTQRKSKQLALFEKDCTACHPGEMSLGKVKTRKEWRETIKRMQKKAPDLICADEIETLVTYHIKKAQEVK